MSADEMSAKRSFQQTVRIVVFVLVSCVLAAGAVLWFSGYQMRQGHSLAEQDEFMERGLRLVAEEFKTKYGHYPKGRSAEIVASLTGRNPEGIEFVYKDSFALNADGEIIAPSGKVMELSSDGEGLVIRAR